MGLQYNVTFRILDEHTGQVVSEHIGHNQATNSLLLGVAHYLKGDGVLNQGAYMLSHFVPKYISLGCMGLINQGIDNTGLPSGIGVGNITDPEAQRFTAYMNQVPGYGADGYDANQNNGRSYLGLGPMFANRANKQDTVACELISNTFPRTEISFRQILPETESELSETVDIVYSAMISTGALAQFRPAGCDYLFITEAGLWASPTWSDSGDNGLLAGYRIVPPNEANWDMTVASNRELLKQQIIRVGINQVVQVVWKLQIGSMKQLIPTPQPNPDPNPPSGTIVTLDTHARTLNVGQSITLTATVVPEQSIIWATSNAGVASVVDGAVTVVSPGIAAITATAADGAAYDSCIITGRVDLPIEGFEPYTVYSMGDLVLGHGSSIYGQYVGVTGQVDWASGSSVISGGEDGHMYALGAGSTTGVNAPIVSLGTNVFNTNVHLVEGCDVYVPDSTEARAFPRGLQSIPEEWVAPVAPPVYYAAGNNNIILAMGETVVITETEATIITQIASDGLETREPYQRTLPDGQIITGYVRQIVLSSNADRGGYKAVLMVGSESQPQHCYILPGTYVIESLTTMGSHNYVEFINTSAAAPIVLYVIESITLAPNNYIYNNNGPDTGLIYCYNNFIIEQANALNFYIMAPNGVVNIKSALPNTYIAGHIYANDVILRDGVSMRSI